MLEIIDDMKAIAGELPWKAIFISVGAILFLELIAMAVLLITL